ncbi:Hypothetical predicted protein [Mytilus galloprovincialis]|uniref:Uncharacterized protein n=1 Tax=Mytilus galloprovincialis TaxID=29158 RepID=A0A8B6HB39_MYTGA|nr:Hypothetical predicted protein [Mytilus galloprovincialis]
MKAINIVLLYTLTSFVDSENCRITLRQDSVICDCQSQYRKLIPQHCPKNTTELLLANNNLGILHGLAFARYTQLRNLDVSSCNITAIEKSAFGNLLFLELLNLFYNPIQMFRSNVFASIGGLQYLSISHYLLSTYPKDSWSDFINLTTVMTNGGLSNGTFAPVFSAMKRLNYFRHFWDYDKSILHNDTFTSFKNISLKTLQLSGKLRRIEKSTFLPLRVLSSLLFSDMNTLILSNTLQSFYVFNDRHMEVIGLNSVFYNYGEYIITPELFQYIGNICLKSLSLRGNQLKLIDGSAIQKMKYKNCLENLDLADNDFDIHQMMVITYYTLFSNLKRIDLFQCDGNRHVKMVHYHYRTRTKSLYFPDHQAKLDNQSNYRKSDFSLSLPSSLEFINASFIGDQSGHSLNSITFTGIKHMKMFDLASTTLEDCNYTFKGLENVEVLNVSNFKCQVLNYRILRSCVNLQQLIMHSSSLGTGLENDHQGVFLKDLKSLQLIDFARNEFKSQFSKLAFQSQLQSLRFLILEGNMFTIMPIYLAGFNQLTFLDIRNNKILYLTNKETNDIERGYTKLKGPLAILLEGNPFVCNCDSLNFVKWLFNTRVKLDRHGNYSCLLYDGSFTTTYEVYKMKQDVENHCSTTSYRGWMIISILLFVVILVVIIVIVGFRYRNHLKTFCLERIIKPCQSDYQKIE